MESIYKANLESIEPCIINDDFYCSQANSRFHMEGCLSIGSKMPYYKQEFILFF